MNKIGRVAPWIKKIKERFTPSTSRVLLIGVLAVFLYSKAEGDSLPSFMFYSLAGVLLTAWIWTVQGVKRLKYTIKMETVRSQVGESFFLEAEVTNQFFLPIPWLELNIQVPPGFNLEYGNKVVVFDLSPREKRTVHYELVCGRRGAYDFGAAVIHMGDLFGIFVREISFQASNKLIVYPKIIPLEGLAIPNFQNMGATFTLRAANEDLTGPTGTRRYVSGDPLNRIHWRATARTGQLRVKEYDLHTSAEVCIFLDLAADSYAGEEETLETGITCAASIANFCFYNRLRYGLVINSSDIYVQPTSRDAGQLLKTLEHLALAKAGEGYLFAQSILLESRSFVPGTTFILITPKIDDKLTEVINLLRRRGYGSLVVQIGPAEEMVKLLEGIRCLSGVNELNLSRKLGGDQVVGRQYTPGTR